MPLTLYFHPLSSYCHKVLIALYEAGVPFAPRLVDLGNAQDAAAFKAIWPLGKFPVLDDGGRIVPESTTIIEYLAARHPTAALIPRDEAAAFEARAADRFYDINVHNVMQAIIGDRLRPADKKDGLGVAQARAALRTALGIAERWMAARRFAGGDGFTIADCAALPPLFYCELAVMPLAPDYPALAAYLARMRERPSYARTLAEAQPYMHLVPR
ncbi:MAG TPA: glutathione S-transferase family protein [Pseudolabrys sp.]|nr:glutathione S-transferase family protein [Pseudolabrys sp.]